MVFFTQQFSSNLEKGITKVNHICECIGLQSAQLYIIEFYSNTKVYSPRLIKENKKRSIRVA